MLLTKNIQALDLTLKINRILIFADFHLGYEEMLNKQGILIPRFQFKDIIKRLKKILQRTKPKLIIINGDLKHEFGAISQQEWRETLKILDLLLQHSKKVILLRGNHDTILGPLAQKRNLQILDSYQIDDILIIHGHKTPPFLKEKKFFSQKNFKKIKTLIIAHEHPALSIREHQHSELFKCFLLGKYKRKTLIVMPSFNPLIEGTDILREKLLSPFLQQNLDNFQAFIIGDKIYNFGKIRDLK